MAAEDDVIVIQTDSSAVVSVSEDNVVSVVDDSTSVVAVQGDDHFITRDNEHTVVVSVGEQGPPGGGGGGGGGEIFILDVSPHAGGIVNGKTYVNDTPELLTCTSDTTTVNVLVGCEGGTDKYMPTVEVNGQPVTLTESTTKRWFTGFATVTLTAGQTNTLTAVSDAGTTDSCEVEVVGAGPEILSITFGAYPGAQTELKAGDTIQITLTTDPVATSITVLGQGATTGTTFTAYAGVATGTITISNASGAQVVTAKARNAFGTFGNEYASSALQLNQTYPSFSTPTVTYPASQTAINDGETATVNCSISAADTVTYSSASLTITNPNTYEINKTVTNAVTGYVNSVNYTITATRAANNATSSTTASVRIATVAPSASLSQVPTGRMVSSPAGTDYEIRITPNQVVGSAPSLTASHGSWQGSWTNMGSYWKRSLRINDAVARGSGSFTALSILGPSGIQGTVISSGSAYTVGGFSSRTVTFPAFSRVAPLGVAVADATKMTATLGATTLTRYTDNAVHSNGFYPANSDGTYNATGTYIGLSDSVFAGSNTTGTLQVTTQEAA